MLFVTPKDSSFLEERKDGGVDYRDSPTRGDGAMGCQNPSPAAMKRPLERHKKKGMAKASGTARECWGLQLPYPMQPMVHGTSSNAAIFNYG